ncbi:MAG: hypothetical protein AAGA56_00615 [Myxococcota bacterium]
MTHTTPIGALAMLAAVLWSTGAEAVVLKPERARLAILDLRFDDAADILRDDEDPALALERARLGLYRGDCDAAVAALDRPDLEDDDELAYVEAIAKGCQRATAGTFVVEDKERGVWVRLQDDADRVLVPYIAEVARDAVDVLEKDLGTRLPDPIRIDLVRDQFALAAHTGLPEEAAQTTGTVAIAKWGRVIMLSPRAPTHGYPWMDTLAHEITHLVISMASRDRAPLWLQEGVAKREETRWRAGLVFDNQPSSDAMAWYGIQTGKALPLTGLGPSIAMLPSPEQAAIAYAEVASFIAYWVDQNGEQALKKLLAELRNSVSGDVSEAIESVSESSLADWDKRWRAHLAQAAPQMPADLDPRANAAKGGEMAKKHRLAELLLGRGHARAAITQLDEAVGLIPSDTRSRCLYSEALHRVGDDVSAAALVADPADIRSPTGRWWSLHSFFLLEDAIPKSLMHAIGTEPYARAVACQELPWGERPADPAMRALCDAAWKFRP